MDRQDCRSLPRRVAGAADRYGGWEWDEASPWGQAILLVLAASGDSLNADEVAKWTSAPANSGVRWRHVCGARLAAATIG